MLNLTAAKYRGNQKIGRQFSMGELAGEGKMKVLRRRNRFYDTTRFGQPEIRVYHKKAKGKRMPRYLLRCGCCEEKLEIYYAEDGLEIGGVNGAIEDWREILLPLLLLEQNGKRLRRRTPEKR